MDLLRSALHSLGGQLFDTPNTFRGVELSERAGDDHILNNNSMSELASRGFNLEQKLGSTEDLALHSSQPPPISGLPAELLEEIFVQTWNDSPFMKSLAPIPHPVLISQVCRTWRVIALGCAGLWTCIPLHIGKQWAYEFAHRSKTLNLILPGVNTAGDYSKLYWLLDFIREHMHRIADLDLERVHEASLPAYHSLLASSALERLVKITLTMGRSHSIQREVVMALNRAPQLREVCLRDMSLPWDVLQWGKLRVVKISLPYSPFEESNLKTLVDCLAAASALETLDLKTEDCRLSHPTLEQPSSTAYLPRLQYFKFEGYTHSFRALCDALRLPPAVSLHLDLREEEEEDANGFSSDDEAEAGPSTLSTLLRAHTSCVQELRIRTNRFEYSVHLEAWPSTPDHHATGVQKGHIEINVQFEREAARRLGHELVALCQNVDARSLRSLHLDCCYDRGNNFWNYKTWRSLLRLARNVESVHFNGPWVHSVLGLLFSPMTRQEPVESPPTTEILLPLARHVHFYRSGLQCRNAYSMRLLPNWINDRARFAPVETLYIESCAISRGTVGKLRGIDGLKFEWDGDQDAARDLDDCEECDGEGCEECLGEDFGFGEVIF